MRRQIYKRVTNYSLSLCNSHKQRASSYTTIDVPDDDIFEGLIDACAHKECLMKNLRRS